MKEHSNNKKIALNLTMTVCNFAITIFISLFITPYIVNTLGGEAYGFVGLANNFVNYASLATIAINSMASRFVSVELFKKNTDEASRYFTSVFFANIAISMVLTPILIIAILYLHKFLNIPPNLVVDVKIAFSIVFLQFILNVLLSRYEIATFVTNKLYLEQRNNLIGTVLRLIIILLAFSFISVKIYILTLGSLVGVLFVYIMNIYYTKKYIPELKVDRNFFSFKYIRTLLASGVWNMINKLSAILLDGLDLLITNIFIGPIEMGALAISKTVPAMFMSLRGTLDYPFVPTMTQRYALGDIPGVVKYARIGNKILCIFMISTMATFTVFGQTFFKLWVPNEDSRMIQILSVLSIISLLAGACINSVFSIFTIANRVKIPSLIMLLTGVLTTITNFVLLKTTNWGVYIIAGVSSVFSLLRNYIFTPLYGAHCLKVKKRTFYYEILTGNLCLILNLALGFIVKKYFQVDNWFTFIVVCAVTASVCVIINSVIVLRKNERTRLISILKAKILRS